MIEAWTASIASAVVASTIALVVAWVITRTWRGLPARVSCWIWRLAFAKSLIAFAWMRPVDVALLPGSTTALAPGLPSVSSIGSTTHVAPHGVVMTELDAAADALMIVWAIGVVFVLVRFAIRASAVRRLRREASACDDAEILSSAAAIARSLGLRRLPPILVADAIGPLSLGIAHPVIVIPTHLSSMGLTADLRVILAHELAHVARRDLMWAWLPELASTLLFFHPLVWLGVRESRLAQELAADAAAVSVTSAEPAAYARILLESALHARARLSATFGLTTTGRQLRRRILAIGTPTSHRLAPLAVGVALAGAITLVPWRITRAASDLGPHATSPDGMTLVSGRADGTIEIRDAASRTLRTTNALVEVVAVAFAPDGQTFATSGRDRSVRLWSLATGELLATLAGHPFVVDHLAFSDDGAIITATDGGDRVVRWDIDSRRPVP